MEEALDIHQALRVFAKIVELGTRQNQGHFFEGIYAESDFDGYNLTLKDASVTLHIHFHNTYDFIFESSQKLDEFVQKIKYIDTLTT